MAPEAKQDFQAAKDALQKRFEPESKRQLYVVEFQTRKRRPDEQWSDFGDELRILADKAFPAIDEKAKDLLSLERYLSELDNPKVAFAVRQRQPKTLDDAVSCTMEMVSYLHQETKGSKISVVSDVPVEERETLMAMIHSLSERMGKLETSERPAQARAVVDSLKVESILGLDFLEKHHGIIDLSKMVLQLEGVSIQLQHHADSSNSSDMLANEVSVSLIETVKIPAYSEIQTMAYTSSTCKGVWLVEGSRPDIPIIVAGAVVTPSIGEPLGSIPVLMCNPLPTETVVHKGTRIARATRLQDESLLAPVTDAMSQEKKIPKVSESKSKLLWEMVQNCAADLTKEEMEMLYHVLMAYADVFAESNDELGRTNMVKHPWASPVVIATKKDGSLCFCVDYRKLNSITRKDAYPLPRIDDSLDALNGSKWFSTLDLICGYWQVEMDENDRQKTAFCTQEGLFEFKVMPFGLCNAPATFQRLMNLVLSGIQWKSCLVYIDDIVIVGKQVKAERKYCVTRKELLAVVTFTKHFRPYLLGRHFTHRTDHSSLQWLYNMKEPEGQLARWLEQLQEYDFAVIHRRGCNHGNADALSRIGPDENEANITGGSSSKGMGVSAVQPQQLQTGTGDAKSMRQLQLEDENVGIVTAIQGFDSGPVTARNITRKSVLPNFARHVLSKSRQVGPITSGDAKKPYILVASDYFTRWAEAYAIPNQEAITVATTLIDEFFCRFSIPQQLHSDQGRQFESDVMKEQAKLPVDLVYGSTPTEPQPQHEYARQLQKILQGAFQAARDNMGTATERMKEVYNQRVLSVLLQMLWEVHVFSQL
ncbi:hypothetical protein EMCRGX_G004601 [Ephydatia muelleri]